MRKLSFCLAALGILLCATTTHAAEGSRRWGVTIGANYNEIHFKQSNLVDVDRMVGGSLGVTGEIMFPGVGIGVDASLLYSLRQGKMHLGDRTVWKSLELGDETARMHFIDVPLNLKYKYRNLGGFENTLAPFIYVGPTFSFCVAGDDLKDEISYSPVSVNLHFGLGAEIANNLQISGGYAFQIGETLHTRHLDQNVAKNRTWQIQATYFF